MKQLIKLKAGQPWYQSQTKRIPRKVNYTSISSLNNDTKLLHKTSENQIKQHIKRLYSMTKWDLFLKYKDGSTCKSIKKIYHNNRMKEKIPHTITSTDAENPRAHKKTSSINFWKRGCGLYTVTISYFNFWLNWNDQLLTHSQRES